MLVFDRVSRDSTGSFLYLGLSVYVVFAMSAHLSFLVVLSPDLYASPTILVFLLQWPREPRELTYVARDTTIFRYITINIEVRRYQQLNESSIYSIFFFRYFSVISAVFEKRKLMAFEPVCTCFKCVRHCGF